MFSSIRNLFASPTRSPAAAAPAAAAPAPAAGSGTGAPLLSFGSKVAYKKQAARSTAEYDYLFKMLLVGDSGVGKSCFLLRFCDDSFFAESFITTIGIDFKIKTVEIGGKRLKLQLWDTAGQERFRTITSSYYRGAHGFFLCYDISNRGSFEHTRTWLSEIERYGSSVSDIALVGMKSDLDATGRREVSVAEAKEFAGSRGLLFSECSSLDGRNIRETALALAQRAASRLGDADIANVDILASTDAEEIGAAAAAVHATGEDDEDVERIAEADLEHSMDSKSASPTKDGKHKRVKKTDVNVFRLGMSNLAQGAEIATGDPVICSRCGAMMSSLSKVQQMSLAAATEKSESSKFGPSFTPAPPIHERFQKSSWVGLADAGSEAPAATTAAPAAAVAAPHWCCEFCGMANQVDDEGERPTASTIDYLVKPAPSVAESSAEPNVVFVVDVSGSMCVTMEVLGGKEFKGTSERLARLQADAGPDAALSRPRGGVTHVSRLQCLQIAVEEQIHRMAREHPGRRVALIAFSNDVTVYGDGEQEPVTIAGDRLNSWEELLKLGSEYRIAKCVRDAEETLTQRLWALEEEGATALGPALLMGIAIAGSVQGSSVILCTDGLANKGLGSLEGRERELVAFYTECGEKAILCGVTVSVLSIIGTECKLDSLGAAVQKTAGSVERVDPRKLAGQLGALVGASQAVAHNVMAMVLLHRSLRFHGEFADEHEQRFWVVKDLGNVTAASECTFSYTFRPKEEIDASGLREIPFQVQLLYTRLDGAIMLRVATTSIPVTDDRTEAERAVNIEVVGTHAAQRAAKLAKEGNYEEAQLEARAAQKLLTRVGADKEMQTTWSSNVEKLDGVVRQAKKSAPANKNHKAEHIDEAAVAISKIESMDSGTLFS